MSYELLGRTLMGVDGLTALETLALVGLADCMNSKTGQCNPTHQTLAKKTNIAARTIPKLIAALVEKGYVERSQSYRPDGTQGANYYVINTEKLPLPPANDRYAHSVGGYAHSVGGYAHSVGGYAHSVSYEPGIEPIIEQDKREVAIAPTTTKPKKVRFDPMAIELPDSVDPALWAEVVQHRRSIKKPIATQLTATKLLNKLIPHSPEGQQAMVDYSIIGGYPNLYEEQAGKLNGHDKRTEHQKRTDAITEATWGSKANDW